MYGQQKIYQHRAQPHIPLEARCAVFGNWNVAYSVYGSLNANMTFVLLPDVAQLRSCWEKQVRPLSEAGYQVITIDLPYQGETVPCRYDLAVAEPEDIFADFLAVVIDTEKLQNVILVAWGAAGICVTHYTAKYSTSHLAGIVLMSALLTPDPALFTHEIWTLLLKVLTTPDEGKAREGEAVVSQFVSLLTLRPAPLKEHLEVFSYTAANLLGCHHLSLALFSSNTPNLHALQQAWKSIPLLWVAGEEDQLVPKTYTHKLVANFPHAVLYEFTQCAHSAHREYPNEVNKQLVDFARCLCFQ